MIWRLETGQLLRPQSLLAQLRQPAAKLKTPEFCFNNAVVLLSKQSKSSVKSTKVIPQRDSSSYPAAVQHPQCLNIQVILSGVARSHKNSPTVPLLYRARTILLQSLTLLKTNGSLGAGVQFLLNQSTSQVLREDVKYWVHPDSQQLEQIAAPLSLATLFRTLHTKLLCLLQPFPQGPSDRPIDTQQPLLLI